MPQLLRALKGVRILSLALNLPGPAALMRCRQMGARCVKLEAPPRVATGHPIPGDPMAQYSPEAYATLHDGIRIVFADLKTAPGQRRLQRELARTDVLITSFRPSALRKLGVDWKTLHVTYPALCMVDIVGAPGTRAEEPGHDLTYLAECGLVPGMELPASLYADMAGSMTACDAVLQVRLNQLQTGRSAHLQVALSEAASYLALPRAWGLTLPKGAVGGAHAGYQVYACKDGRVAIAALESHFARALCVAAGITLHTPDDLLLPTVREQIAAFLGSKTRRQLDRLSVSKDIPLVTLPG
jgi:crotonobetainyl-CoA:carnitine CoA-transferase CaiB-like acyl-CoA transferase